MSRAVLELKLAVFQIASYPAFGCLSVCAFAFGHPYIRVFTVGPVFPSLSLALSLSLVLVNDKPMHVHDAFMNAMMPNGIGSRLHEDGLGRTKECLRECVCVCVCYREND